MRNYWRVKLSLLSLGSEPGAWRFSLTLVLGEEIAEWGRSELQSRVGFCENELRARWNASMNPATVQHQFWALQSYQDKIKIKAHVFMKATNQIQWLSFVWSTLIYSLWIEFESSRTHRITYNNELNTLSIKWMQEEYVAFCNLWCYIVHGVMLKSVFTAALF